MIARRGAAGATCRRLRAPVVLLVASGGWASTVKLAASLVNAGLSVAVAAPASNPVRAVPGLAGAFGYAPPRPVHVLARAIAESGCELVIPCDERALGHLHELVREDTGPIHAVIARSLGRPEAYPVVRDRAALLETAVRVGVATPPFARISGPADLERFGDIHGWPAALKLSGSSGGRGVRRADDLASALAARAALEAPVRPRELARAIVNRDVFALGALETRAGLIAQAWIDGRPANCAVFAKDGVILGAIAVEVLETGSAFGPSCLVECVDGREMLEAAERIVGALRLSGFAGFDFILDARTGQPQLLEMNARAAPPCHVRRPGGDLVTALAESLGVRPAAVTGPDPARIAYFPDAEIADLSPDQLDGSVSDQPPGPDALLDLIYARCVPYRARRRLARNRRQISSRTEALR